MNTQDRQAHCVQTINSEFLQPFYLSLFLGWKQLHAQHSVNILIWTDLRFCSGNETVENENVQTFRYSEHFQIFSSTLAEEFSFFQGQEWTAKLSIRKLF